MAQNCTAELGYRERVRHVQFLRLEYHHVPEASTGYVGPTGAKPELRRRVLADEVTALGFNRHNYTVARLRKEIGVVVDESVNEELPIASLFFSERGALISESSALLR